MKTSTSYNVYNSCVRGGGVLLIARVNISPSVGRGGGTGNLFLFFRFRTLTDSDGKHLSGWGRVIKYAIYIVLCFTCGGIAGLSFSICYVLFKTSDPDEKILAGWGRGITI